MTDVFLQRPLVQQIIRAQDDLISSLCFGKNCRPEELDKQRAARDTLDLIRINYPATFKAVMRRLGR